MSKQRFIERLKNHLKPHYGDFYFFPNRFYLHQVKRVNLTLSTAISITAPGITKPIYRPAPHRKENPFVERFNKHRRFTLPTLPTPFSLAPRFTSIKFSDYLNGDLYLNDGCVRWGNSRYSFMLPLFDVSTAKIFPEQTKIYGWGYVGPAGTMFWKVPRKTIERLVERFLSPSNKAVMNV